MEKQDKKELVSAYKERKVIGGIYAIKNTVNGKKLLLQSADLKGAENRFNFAKETGGCIHLKLQNDWGVLGAGVFEFEILDELEKKDIQTPKQFKEDLEELLEIWMEKMDREQIY